MKLRPIGESFIHTFSYHVDIERKGEKNKKRIVTIMEVNFYLRFRCRQKRADAVDDVCVFFRKLEKRRLSQNPKKLDQSMSCLYVTSVTLSVQCVCVVE